MTNSIQTPTFLFEKDMTGTPNSIAKRLGYYRNILGYLYNHSQTSVADIVNYISLSQPLVAVLFSELMDYGIIQESGVGASIGGRPPKVFALNPDYQYVVGIDVSLHSVRIALFNLHNEILYRHEYRPMELENTTGYADTLCKVIDRCLAKMNIGAERILACGLSLPGLVDADKGFAFTHLSCFPKGISTYLEEKLGFSVLLENDSNMMAMGEKWFGLAVEKQHVLCVYMGNGIGLGITIDGTIYRGAQGLSGEFGHILIDPDGDLCSCGKIGCLETLCSGTVITQKINAALHNGQVSLLTNSLNEDGEVYLDDIVKAISDGDQFSIDQLATAGNYLGRGLATLIHLFNPELIIIGGKLAHTGKYILDPVEQALNKYLMTQFREKTEIVCSKLLDNATLMGTMAHVMSRVINR